MGNYESTRLHEESSLEGIEEHLQFTYDKPVVSSYSQIWAASGGNTITLKGYNFGPDKDHIVQNLTTVVTVGVSCALAQYGCLIKKLNVKFQKVLGLERKLL